MQGCNLNGFSKVFSTLGLKGSDNGDTIIFFEFIPPSHFLTRILSRFSGSKLLCSVSSHLPFLGRQTLDAYKEWPLDITQAFGSWDHPLSKHPHTFAFDDQLAQSLLSVLPPESNPPFHHFNSFLLFFPLNLISLTHYRFFLMASCTLGSLVVPCGDYEFPTWCFWIYGIKGNAVTSFLFSFFLLFSVFNHILTL